MLSDVWAKFRLFQKPANYDARLAECERTLSGVRSQVGQLEIGSVEQDVVQSQLEQCMVCNGITMLDRGLIGQVGLPLIPFCLVVV